MGKKKSKTKTTSTPWAPIQQPIINAVNTASGIVSGNQGNLDQLASGVRGQLPALQNMAFGPNPALQAGMGYAQDVLGGKYLGQGNPYLQGMIDETGQNVGNQVNSTFSMAGRTGGGNHVERLGQGLATAENNLRYQDYDAERQRMAQQGALLPGLSAAQFAGMPSWLQAVQTAGNLPYAGVGALSPIIGLAGGHGKQTGTQPGGWGGDLLNAAASIGSAAIMASARVLKADIEEIGLWDGKDDLKRYRYRYKNDPSRTIHEGVMAEDVERLRPWAFVPHFTRDGHPGVNYAKLGEAA